MDLLGSFIKNTGNFKGKHYLLSYWLSRAKRGDIRLGSLPGNLKVYCDVSLPYEAMVWLGAEETDDLNLAYRLLQSGQTFIDCGANIGIWSLTGSAAVGDKGVVHAFEPTPSTFEKLKKNIAVNNISNITPRQQAVGASAGSVYLTTSEFHNVNAVVTTSSEQSVSVEAVTLDDILGMATVHAIKIDVEGQEAAVLRGAERILSEQKPWLCIEFNSELNAGGALKDWDVHTFLKSKGYEPYLFKDIPNDFALSASRILPDEWSVSGYCNLLYKAGK